MARSPTDGFAGAEGATATSWGAETVCMLCSASSTSLVGPSRLWTPPLPASTRERRSSGSWPSTTAAPTLAVRFSGRADGSGAFNAASRSFMANKPDRAAFSLACSVVCSVGAATLGSGRGSGSATAGSVSACSGTGSGSGAGSGSGTSTTTGLGASTSCARRGGMRSASDRSGSGICRLGMISAGTRNSASMIASTTPKRALSLPSLLQGRRVECNPGLRSAITHLRLYRQPNLPEVLVHTGLHDLAQQPVVGVFSRHDGDFQALVWHFRPPAPTIRKLLRQARNMGIRSLNAVQPRHFPALNQNGTTTDLHGQVFHRFFLGRRGRQRHVCRILHNLHIGRIHHQKKHQNGENIHQRHQVQATGLVHPAIVALAQAGAARCLHTPPPSAAGAR